MTIPAVTKNNFLNGQTFTLASLHTAFPGSTGTNELTGGTYAQQAITINAASGGVRALNAGVSFTGLPVTTIKWIGFWNGATFVAGVPNGGATPKNFMSIAATDVVYSMEATETEFYAHQFKPVLKLLNSPTDALLIADEVGLGKTIEAGLILKELKARGMARRTLVLAPSGSVSQWQFELKTKFNETFAQLDSRTIPGLEATHPGENAWTLYDKKGTRSSGCGACGCACGT